MFKFLLCKKHLVEYSKRYVNSIVFSRRFFQNDVKQYLDTVPNVYDQKRCEAFWSQIWDRSDLFKQRKSTDKIENEFRLLLPPPNITGSLHLGIWMTSAARTFLTFEFNRSCLDCGNSRFTLSISPDEWTPCCLVRWNRPCWHCYTNGCGEDSLEQIQKDKARC